LGEFFNVFLLLFCRERWLLGFGQKIGKDSEEYGLIVIGLDPIVSGNFVPLDFRFHVGLGSKDFERVLHLIKLEQLLDELERVLALSALCQFLDLEIFSKEGRGLTVK
jgi:hypothetical protein